MLFLFEYRGAKTLISEQFPPDIGAAISSFRVDSDIVSLNGREALQADAEVGHDGKVYLSSDKPYFYLIGLCNLHRSLIHITGLIKKLNDFVVCQIKNSM